MGCRTLTDKNAGKETLYLRRRGVQEIWNQVERRWEKVQRITGNYLAREEETTDSHLGRDSSQNKTEGNPKRENLSSMGYQKRTLKKDVSRRMRRVRKH